MHLRVPASTHNPLCCLGRVGSSRTVREPPERSQEPAPKISLFSLQKYLRASARRFMTHGSDQERNVCMTARETWVR